MSCRLCEVANYLRGQRWCIRVRALSTCWRSECGAGREEASSLGGTGEGEDGCGILAAVER